MKRHGWTSERHGTETFWQDEHGFRCSGDSTGCWVLFHHATGRSWVGLKNFKECRAAAFTIRTDDRLKNHAVGIRPSSSKPTRITTDWS